MKGFTYSVAKIGCKVIELDGTLPVKENVEIIKNNISGGTYR